MAISFVGSGTKVATLASATTFTFSTELFDASNTAGPTLQQDDWVYVACAKGHQAAAVSVPTITTTGYAQVGTSQYGDDQDDISLAVYRKKMGASPDTTVVMSSATSLQQEMIVFVFRGLDTTTPDDASPVGATGINGGQADPGSITPVTAGAWIFAVGGGALNDALNAYSNITGFSSTTNHFQRVQNSASVFLELGATIKTDWTSGALDPGAFGGTANVSTRSGWAALTMALKPAGALSGISGSLSSTLDAVTISATGRLAIAGSLSATLGALALSSSGKLAITGSLNTTLGTLTASATGVLPITGTLTATLGTLTATATGALSGTITASLSVALGALTVTASGKLSISGSLSVMLDPMVLASFGTVETPPRRFWEPPFNYRRMRSARR